MFPLASGPDTAHAQSASKGLQEELNSLQLRLAELESTLNAIAIGQVDAVIDPLQGSITLLHQAQVALQHSARLQQAILDALPATLAILDNSGTILAVNEAWIQFAVANGYRGSEYGRGLNYLEICAAAYAQGDQDAGTALQGISEVLSGNLHSYSMEYPCHAPEAWRWFRLYVAPVANKLHHKVVVMHIDITELKQLEIQRAQTHKLEAVGALAAGIAHEINTPIQFIGDNVHFLADAFADLQKMHRAHQEIWHALHNHEPVRALVPQWDSAETAADWDYLCTEIPAAIEQTMEGIARVASIVRAMRSFAHPPGGEMTPADLNEALQNSLLVARNEYKYVADVVTELDPHLPLVLCDLGDLNQVFLNLIVNSAHAIADKISDTFGRGTITVRTAFSDGEVMIAVADNGIGIPQENHNRLFEPFFTTKAVGRGTGQGLAIAHAIITKKHKGRLQFSSQPGEGSVFTVYLPARRGS